MIIPNVPIERLSKQNGVITDQWSAFLQNLITNLRINLSDDGYVVPFRTNDEILQLNTTDNVGRILYNTTTERMMINNTGTFEEIETV